MTISAGSCLGPYRVLSLLGAGGMGEVYRARDTRLERDVAIKSLPAEFAQDSERLARFRREARLLASLNHTNLAAIYGLEEADGAKYLVLEIVEGESLAQKLAAGPLPVEEALALCAQIASGVSAAHEAGVIHRDLKPGNVMVRPDGSVKVLDFGLAKETEAPGSSGDLSASPTISVGTRTGVILGTAPYTSPEQARGRPLDRRTDIWSFGCVLYECLTGRRIFREETVSDTLASIIRSEPDWSALPPETPSKIRDLLRRCLQKDPRRRLRDIGDAGLELATPFREFSPFLSPDGRFLAYTSNESGRHEVYVRPVVGSGQTRISIDGGAEAGWSPDGRKVYYRSGGKLFSVAVLASLEFSAGPANFVLPKSYDSGTREDYPRNWDIAPDGSRFLLIREQASNPPATIAELQLLENWRANVERPER